MKHAGNDEFDIIEPMLKQLRTHDELREKKRGIFYLKSRSFMHFHEHESLIYSDVRFGDDFERYSVNTPSEIRKVLALVKAYLDAQYR